MDAEEQEQPLVEGEDGELRSARGPSKPLLLAALGLAALVCVALSSTVEVVKGRGAASKELGRGLPGLIQAHALDRLGRQLTQPEVEAVSAHLVGIGPARAARVRVLQGINNLGHMGESDLEDSGISDACSLAVMDMFSERLEKLSNLLAEILMACMFDDQEEEEGAACLAAQAKADEFDTSFTEDCKADGDTCNITTKDAIDGVQERSTEMVCIPAECRGEVESVVVLLHDNMEEDMGEAIKKESKKGWVKDVEDEGEHMELGTPSVNITCQKADWEVEVHEELSEDGLAWGVMPRVCAQEDVLVSKACISQVFV